MLNITIFTTVPILVKIVLVSISIFFLYDYEYLLINFGSMTLYFIANYCINNWRAKLFKDKSEKDQGYNQKAIDSMLNFETVKYFNGEEHERNRFYNSLLLYKDS